MMIVHVYSKIYYYIPATGILTQCQVLFTYYNWCLLGWIRLLGQLLTYIIETAQFTR